MGTVPQQVSRYRHDEPVRVTLAAQLGGDLDGAWWPYGGSVARELPELIDALRAPLGDIVDVAVNWSSRDGVPDLNVLIHRTAAPVPGQRVRRQRVITITGTAARVNLLVVPSRTTRVLATFLLRRAAALPIMLIHEDTDACRAADGIIRAARAEGADRRLRARPVAPTADR